MSGSSLLSLVTVLPDEPKEVCEGAIREWTISPSSVSLWIECERKWGYRYIAKLSSPSADSALLGTDGHSQAEAFLGGVSLGLDFSRPSGAIMQAGMHLWPAPKTPGMTLEKKFRFRSERTGFTYSGLKDIDITPNVPVPTLGFDGWAPIVIDHKTTSSIDKYAKSVETLHYDAQTTIYGLDSMARYQSPAVDLGWIYYQTKGTKRAKPVTLRVELAHTLKVFDAVEEIAREMSAAKEAYATSPNHSAVGFVKSSMKANPAACGAYGGCPYQHVCNLSPAERMRSALSKMSLISDLKNRVQGVTTTTNTEASNPSSETQISGGELPADHPLNKPYEPKSAAGAAAVGAPFIPPTEEPKDDPINPPEGNLPPPPPVDVTPAPAPTQTTETEKRKPGRPRKAKPEETSDETRTVQSPVVQSTGNMDGSVPERVEVKATNTPTPFAANKLFLYVDCIPEGISCVNADALVAKANAKIVAGGQVAHYKFLKFGEAAAALAIALNEVLDEEAPAYVFVSSSSDAMPVLTPRASMVTRSVR